MEKYSGHQRRNKDQCERLAGRQQCDGRARAEPGQSPADAEQRCTDNQPAVDLPLPRQLQCRSKHGDAACAHPSIGDGRRDQCARHHQRQ